MDQRFRILAVLLSAVLIFLIITGSEESSWNLLLLSVFSLGLLDIEAKKYLSEFQGTTRQRSAIVVGTGSLARKVGQALEAENISTLRYLKIDQETTCVPRHQIVTCNGDFMDRIVSMNPGKIVLSLSERRGILPVKQILALKFSGIEVLDAQSFYERSMGKLLLDCLTPGWLIFSKGFQMTRWMSVIKRATDIVCSILLLSILLPLFPMIALAIKLESKGPVIFKQKRLGLRERVFTIYKFRSMRKDAEIKTGAVWAMKDDPRVTTVGKFLRKTRLDELPQLVNVLRGEMSLIGPRPERPEFLPELKKKIPYYSERHLVKPGITGWAQINYSYGASVDDSIEKLSYDLYYIKNVSLRLDLRIVLRTIYVVLFGRGAR